MGVAALLELDSPDRPLLVAADLAWDRWMAAEGVLAGPGSVADLRPWLRAADPAAADEVLLVLARLGSADGAGEVPAAGVLAWSLLPGACALAHQLRTATGDIDAFVAGQLWIGVRSFPWWRLSRVAGNILANTRSAVLRECGYASSVARVDRIWARTRLFDPQQPVWTQKPAADSVDEPPVTGEVELANLLEAAGELGVVTKADRDLLVRLVSAADGCGVSRSGRGSGGLMANAVSTVVAGQVGVSPATVRRRARRAIGALRDACRDGVLVW